MNYVEVSILQRRPEHSPSIWALYLPATLEVMGQQQMTSRKPYSCHLSWACRTGDAHWSEVAGCRLTCPVGNRMNFSTAVDPFRNQPPPLCHSRDVIMQTPTGLVVTGSTWSSLCFTLRTSQYTWESCFRLKIYPTATRARFNYCLLT